LCLMRFQAGTNLSTKTGNVVVGAMTRANGRDR
jgi:hypothetical protein